MIIDRAKMAGRAVSLDVELAGVIPAEARSELVKELVKFILYQRNQIPMYFDQLADSLARESQSVENSVTISRFLPLNSMLALYMLS